LEHFLSFEIKSFKKESVNNKYLPKNPALTTKYSGFLS